MYFYLHIFNSNYGPHSMYSVRIVNYALLVFASNAALSSPDWGNGSLGFLYHSFNLRTLSILSTSQLKYIYYMSCLNPNILQSLCTRCAPSGKLGL
jgi:hypothetical protein